MITQGKWKVVDEGDVFIEAGQPPEKPDITIAEVYDSDDMRGGELYDNARLIAAAPELLAACEAAMEFIGRSNKTDWDNEITPVLDKAIAAAKT